MNESADKVILQELFEALSHVTSIDLVDWNVATQFARRWKLSIADALLDLNFVDETALAKALAKAHNLTYLPGQFLKSDFTGIDFETFDDLLTVGAVPLTDERLAICNPYDDLRGNLGKWLCNREMVITERTPLFDVLRRRSLSDWMQAEES